MKRAAVLALSLWGVACPLAPDSSVPLAPLPAGGFLVEWRPVTLPTHLKPGEACATSVTVVNAGSSGWAAAGNRPYGVRLGYRWFKGSDAQLYRDYDNVRVPLPHAAPPGRSVTIPVTVVAPAEPGDYVVQFDLNQTGVAWFANSGAALKLVLVKVG